ncbi:hypothetical protein [Deinococcus aquaticus]|uniref:hypothetical protein n=1 Tax=Deinococcus aquaticus TaxID=328692 RepID=UPI00361D3FAC
MNDLPALPPTESGNAATPPAPPPAAPITPPVIPTPTPADPTRLTLLIPTGPARPPFTLEQTDPRTLTLTLFGPHLTPSPRPPRTPC